MNELRHEKSRIYARILITALVSHHIGRNMNELVQARSRIHANTVKSALTSYQIAGDMNTRTREMTRNTQTL